VLRIPDRVIQRVEYTVISVGIEGQMNTEQ